MENFMFFDMPHEERVATLAKLSIGRETMTFKRSLSSEDVAERKDLYTREAMRLATVKDDFKEYKARKTADIKAIEKNQEAALEVIANESVEVFDEVFRIPNFDKGLILFVDKRGEIVHEREMKPDERQGRLMLEGATVKTDGESNEESGSKAEDIDYEEIKPGENQPEKEGNEQAETEAPPSGKSKRGRKPGKINSVADVAKEIVNESQPENFTDLEGMEEKIKTSGIPQADADAMQRVAEMDNEDNK